MFMVLYYLFKYETQLTQYQSKRKLIYETEDVQLNENLTVVILL